MEISEICFLCMMPFSMNCGYLLPFAANSQPEPSNVLVADAAVVIDGGLGFSSENLLQA